MATLEEMGFLYKPHVVAGRVPTDRAYRYYVDRINTARVPGKRELRALDTVIRPRYVHVGAVLGDASKVLASISRLAGIVVEPKVETMLFQEVEFVKLSRTRILVVFVTSSGTVHSRLVISKDDLDVESLNNMKEYMNRHFGGVPFFVLKDRLMADIRKDREKYTSLILKIRDTLDTIIEGGGQREVYIEGTLKMIDVPEFSDIYRLRELLGALEHKEKLLSLLDRCLSKDGINVIIGIESDVREMKDMSLITSTYRVGDKSYGILGVIGPVRMNYSRIIPIVSYAAQRMTDVLSTVYEG